MHSTVPKIVPLKSTKGNLTSCQLINHTYGMRINQPIWGESKLSQKCFVQHLTILGSKEGQDLKTKLVLIVFTVI